MAAPPSSSQCWMSYFPEGDQNIGVDSSIVGGQFPSRSSTTCVFTGASGSWTDAF